MPMAKVVTLQVGQCGNQLGQALFDTMQQSTDATTTAAAGDRAIFFHACDDHNRDRDEARCVLVDQEPKVIDEILARGNEMNTWRYDRSMALCGEGGSGNNWAAGYAEHGPKVEESVLDLVRKEAEAADVFGGCKIIHSVAGGTGSGLGSFLTRAIVDRFEDSKVFNVLVWPHDSGEVVVQSYNSVLTIASLQEYSHGMVNLFNDDAHAICSRMYHQKRPSLEDMNKILARDIFGAFYPSRSFDSGRYDRDLLASIARCVCPHPSLKMLSIKSVPQTSREMLDYSSHTWTGLLKHLHQMHATHSSIDEKLDWTNDPGINKNKSVANMLVLRGQHARETCHEMFSKRDERMIKMMTGFLAKPSYASWTMDGRRFHLRYREDGKSGAKSMFLLSNSQSLISPISKVLNKAHGMWQANAFVHQYEQYGITSDDFRHCFVVLQQMMQDYKML